MSANKNISFIHEKLGELNIPTNAKGHPTYKRAIVEKIFLSSLQLLQNENLISTDEHVKLVEMIKSSEIAIVENLGSRITYQYQYHSSDGAACPLSIYVDSMNEWLQVGDTVDALIDILCQVVASVLHPEDNIDDDAETKGPHWEKYAKALLPEDKIMHNLLHSKLYSLAMRYFNGKVTGRLRELLLEEYGDDWEDTLAEGYANDVLSDLEGFEAFENNEYMSMEDFIKNEVYNHEWEVSLS